MCVGYTGQWGHDGGRHKMKRTMRKSQYKGQLKGKRRSARRERRRRGEKEDSGGEDAKRGTDI